MPKIQTSLFLLAMLGVMSFTGIPSTDEPIVETITYGTCGCIGDVVTGPKVELSLHPDHTFHYLNNSDSAHKVDQEGTWIKHGNKVVLQADQNKISFHRTWKLDKNESCIISRKGLKFIRLCNIKACK